MLAHLPTSAKQSALSLNHRYRCIYYRCIYIGVATTLETGDSSNDPDPVHGLTPAPAATTFETEYSRNTLCWLEKRVSSNPFDYVLGDLSKDCRLLS